MNSRLHRFAWQAATAARRATAATAKVASALGRALPGYAFLFLVAGLLAALVVVSVPAGRPGAGRPLAGSVSPAMTSPAHQKAAGPGTGQAPSRHHSTGRHHPQAPSHHRQAGRPHRRAGGRRHPAQAQVITLMPGDTLWGLALRYHTTVHTLQALNHLGTSTLIYAGAAFHVPGPHHRAATPRAGQHPLAHWPRADTAAVRAVAYARAQLGKPYIWGGTGPAGYDCSGLVMRAWQAAGVQLPRTTYSQVNAGTHIARGQLAPGDLVFSNDTGHVQMYLGHGQVIQAPEPGESVDIVPLPAPWLVDAYVHV